MFPSCQPGSDLWGVQKCYKGHSLSVKETVEGCSWLGKNEISLFWAHTEHGKMDTVQGDSGEGRHALVMSLRQEHNRQSARSERGKEESDLLQLQKGF